MAIKRTVVLAGVSSAVLIVGSSAFAFANGILAGHRADPVGSYVPVAARLADESQPAGPAPTKEAPTIARSTTTSVAHARGEGSDDDRQPPPVASIPVTAPAPPMSVDTPATTPAAQRSDDEYTKGDSEHESEPEDEAVIDDDHHGRDDDD